MVNETFTQYEKDLDAWYSMVTKDPKGYKKPWRKLLTSNAFLWRIALCIGGFISMMVVLWPTVIIRDTWIGPFYINKEPFLTTLDPFYYIITLLTSCFFIAGFYNTLSILISMYHFAPIHAYAQRDYYKTILEGLPVIGGIPTVAMPPESPKLPLINLRGKFKRKGKVEIANPVDIPPMSNVIEKNYKHMVEDFFTSREVKKQGK